MPTCPERLRLRLPATSANLGPGFDALGMALDLWLTVEAECAEEFSIEASGRDAALAGSLDRNLILETYRGLAPSGPALRLRVENQIPLGMGCGSSAAALLAGVLLSNHFGALGMSEEAVLSEACRREGHPDNVAACFHGGITASAMIAGDVVCATFGRKLEWPLYLVLPRAGLATKVARALLPDLYSRADAVQNVQSTALLVAAAALDRPELLRAATRDRLHQPYRAAVCPLLATLAPLADATVAATGVLAVTLSGAGPSVLVWAAPQAQEQTVVRAIRGCLAALPCPETYEVLKTRIAGGYLAL